MWVDAIDYIVLLKFEIYDLIMDPVNTPRITAVDFRLNEFPPVPERLLNLTNMFARSGFNHIVIDWGPMFPWSIDERFRSGYAYTEKVIDSFCRRAKALGLGISMRIPFGGGFGCFLRYPGYHSLRSSGSGSINPETPGGAKFVCDLLDDALSLIPGLDGIFLG